MLFEAPVGTFTGTGQANIVDPGVNPEVIIKLTDVWSVRVQWEITGLFPFPWIGGKWQVQAFLERIGPGADLIVNPTPVDVPVGPDPVDILIQPINGHLVQEGMYRLAVSIIFKDHLNNPRPTAAFQDGPTLQFYS
jgi:hypothetical protein